MALYTNEQLLEMTSKDLNKDMPSFLWLKELLDTFNNQITELNREHQIVKDAFRTEIKTIVNDISAMQKQINTLKLLIEHEEKVRTTKATKTRTKTVVPKFKVGDRVKETATNTNGYIIGIIKGRAQIKKILGESIVWCNLKSLEYFKG